ncbi:glycosyltransferase family protein [Mucilaginibacter psychrotolerans]|uniref:Glycosyl transferase n=1 Tax=Mucilaginibacter psychrotolerans TaxID=1524096 RepID=A0A4Y8SIW6_9SPHI|nr:hypothetical protein [Mucilaginibacter psychrotolerans]TFF38822.1 hypothetical protein E2R66_07390 [Mucilaginibacter psychrotolerans]
MKVAYTICANNYLASAKVLKESFTKHHPDTRLFIVLVDKKSPVLDYDEFCGDSILFVDQLVDLDIDALSLKFSLAELCTTVKPFVFKYFFKQYDTVVYIDPDIKVYAPMTDVWEALQKHTFVLTPHLMNPVDDGKIPSDFYTLRTGIFNLGFLGLAKGTELDKFLNWWGERLLVYGYTNWDKGMFYDQIWANYIPVMFDNYHILKHYGYNVANWNWHERTLAKSGDGYTVNGKYPLVFFHFSSYRYATPMVLCKYNTRYNRFNRPDIAEVVDEYYTSLKAAGADKVKEIPAFYQEQFLVQELKMFAARPLREKIRNRLTKIVERIF